LWPWIRQCCFRCDTKSIRNNNKKGKRNFIRIKKLIQRILSIKQKDRQPNKRKYLQIRHLVRV
jgi:hypothetical protein